MRLRTRTPAKPAGIATTASAGLNFVTDVFPAVFVHDICYFMKIFFRWSDESTDTHDRLCN